MSFEADEIHELKRELYNLEKERDLWKAECLAWREWRSLASETKEEPDGTVIEDAAYEKSFDAFMAVVRARKATDEALK